MSTKESKEFEGHLEDDDWAIIIGADGNLKGVFIPDGCDEEEVPESIVQIMATYFGIDFNEDEQIILH